MERYEKIDVSDLQVNGVHQNSRRNQSKFVGLQTPNPNYYSNATGNSISPHGLQSRRQADTDSTRQFIPMS